MQTPKSEEDIQGLVSRAVIESRKIRVLGTGHSWSEIAQTEDIMVYLDQFKGIRVNKLEKTVTCRAGNTMKEVIAALDEAGLAMENLDSISTQTVGGIVATGMITAIEHIITNYQCSSKQSIGGRWLEKPLPTPSNFEGGWAWPPVTFVLNTIQECIYECIIPFDFKLT